MKSVFGILIFSVAAVLAANELCWEPMFAPGAADVPEIILDVDCVDPSLCYLAGGSNGVGFGVYSYDGQMNGQVKKMKMQNMSLMILAVTAGGTKAKPVGATGGVAMFVPPVNIGLTYLDNGTIWKPSTVPFDWVEAVQTMSSTSSGQHIIAVDSGTTQQVYHSTNAGQSYTAVPITGLPPLKNCSGPGWIAMVDDNTWYLTLGQFPDDNAGMKGRRVRRNLDGSFSVKKSRTVTVHYDVNGKIRVSHNFKKNVNKKDECSGYAAQIAKTIDGGKTWTAQFTQNDTFSFGGIDCIDSKHCVAAGSGDVSSYIYTTVDGTTWNKILQIDPSGQNVVDLNTVRYVNSSDIWIGGSIQNAQSQSAVGAFYFSKDGGKTFLQYPQLQPEIAVIMDISFINGEGFASAVALSSTSTILRYAEQPYYGYFTQSDCVLPGCALCQNNTFPQGMCLQVNGGGSAKVFCTTGGLKTNFYNSTTCVGNYSSQVDPVNTCLNGTDGSYYENFCDSSVHALHSEVDKRFKLLK